MEKESVKDVILRYGVLLGKRNTERQKTDFLRAAQKQLEQAGFPVDITCVSASLMRRESVNMYNLYAGDFKKADVSSSRIMIRRCGSFSQKSRKPLMRTGQGEISFSIPCCFYAV